MSDRLALANAIEDAGIERGKAERVASVIFDAIHDNVATKADVEASAATLRSEMATVRSTLSSEIATVRTDVVGLRGEVALAEHRLFTRLGSLIVVMAGAVIAGLHYWPPH
jgi:hypothetical protein